MSLKEFSPKIVRLLSTPIFRPPNTMFSKFHIHQNGFSLCHSGEGVLIAFEDVAGMNPIKCCEDCLRRFKNITGIDIKKQPINKALLREKTESNET